MDSQINSPSFYSKLVRLKEFVDIAPGIRGRRFLFQIGSIKREHWKQDLQITEEFLFQIGSIKREEDNFIILQPTKVSIPNWFD